VQNLDFLSKAARIGSSSVLWIGFMGGLASSNRVADEEHAGDVMLGTVWSYEEVRLKDGTEDAGDGGLLSDSFSVSDEGMWNID
jgi:hypothetical protein